MSRGTAAEWAAGMQATFEDACGRAGGVVAHDYVVGGHSVRLRFAGPALVP